MALGLLKKQLLVKRLEDVCESHFFTRQKSNYQITWMVDLPDHPLLLPWDLSLILTELINCPIVCFASMWSYKLLYRRVSLCIRLQFKQYILSYLYLANLVLWPFNGVICLKYNHSSNLQVFIMGFGDIGFQLAKRLRPFGVKVLATKRSWDLTLQSKGGINFKQKIAVL